eukprot:CCRYP_010106-RA/>CCRYP_010106-RA protein AED:0.21 eAED:0.21 QI:1096/0.5/0.66/1/0/0/3/0/260
MARLHREEAPSKYSPTEEKRISSESPLVAVSLRSENAFDTMLQNSINQVVAFSAIILWLHQDVRRYRRKTQLEGLILGHAKEGLVIDAPEIRGIMALDVSTTRMCHIYIKPNASVAVVFPFRFKRDFMCSNHDITAWIKLGMRHLVDNILKFDVSSLGIGSQQTEISSLQHKTRLAIEAVLVRVHEIVVARILISLHGANNTEFLYFTQLGSTLRRDESLIEDRDIDVANQIICRFKIIDLDGAKHIPSTIINDRIRLET